MTPQQKTLNSCPRTLCPGSPSCLPTSGILALEDRWTQARVQPCGNQRWFFQRGVPGIAGAELHLSQESSLKTHRQEAEWFKVGKRHHSLANYLAQCQLWAKTWGMVVSKSRHNPSLPIPPFLVGRICTDGWKLKLREVLKTRGAWFYEAWNKKPDGSLRRLPGGGDAWPVFCQMSRS